MIYITGDASNPNVLKNFKFIHIIFHFKKIYVSRMSFNLQLKYLTIEMSIYLLEVRVYPSFYSKLMNNL